MHLFYWVSVDGLRLELPNPSSTLIVQDIHQNTDRVSYDSRLDTAFGNENILIISRTILHD